MALKSVMPRIIFGIPKNVNRHSESGFRPNAGMETIGQRVRKKRLERGMSSKALAEAAGLAQSTLTELEKGDSKSTTKLHRIADALGVDVNELDPPKGRRGAKKALAPIQQAIESSEKNSESASLFLRRARPILREGLVKLRSFYEANEGKLHVDDDDLDLLLRACEWNLTFSDDLLTDLFADIRAKVKKQGEARSEPETGKVGIKRVKSKAG